MKSVSPSSELKIAIVDDDVAARLNVARVLQAEGWGVSVYDTAGTFLESAARNRVACAIIDISFQDASEFDSPASSIGFKAGYPVIALSVNDDAATRERARRLGAAALFRKPVEAQALLDAVRWLVGSARSA